MELIYRCLGVCDIMFRDAEYDPASDVAYDLTEIREAIGRADSDREDHLVRRLMDEYAGLTKFAPID